MDTMGTREYLSIVVMQFMMTEILLSTGTLRKNQLHLWRYHYSQLETILTHMKNHLLISTVLYNKSTSSQHLWWHMKLFIHALFIPHFQDGWELYCVWRICVCMASTCEGFFSLIKFLAHHPHLNLQKQSTSTPNDSGWPISHQLIHNGSGRSWLLHGMEQIRQHPTIT